MTPEQFKQAQESLLLTNNAMSTALGVSLPTVNKYRSGRTKVPKPVQIIINFMK